MTANSKIEWTDHTFNPWIGCTKIGPGCDLCYAEAQNARFAGGNWGPGAERKRTSQANWKEPLKWDRAAAKAGKPAFVFCASMADVFDNEADNATRADLWALMADTPNLVWIIVTKRGPNVPKMIPDHWYRGQWPKNIWLLYTICNQAEADREVPRLLEQKARFHIPIVGLSMEPLLGPVDLTCLRVDEIYSPDAEPHNDLNALTGVVSNLATPITQTIPGLDWIITGGESGGRIARPMHPDWALSLRDQCEEAGVAFFFKQWGSCVPCTWEIGDTGPNSTGWIYVIDEDHCKVDYDDLGKGWIVEAHGREFVRFSHKHTGNVLDNQTHLARPEATT